MVEYIHVMSDNYSMREIDQLLKAAKDASDSNRAILTEQLDRIEVQTTRTNGRVTGLETRASKLENWQAYVIGFCVCISMFVIPLVLYSLRNAL